MVGFEEGVVFAEFNAVRQQPYRFHMRFQFLIRKLIYKQRIIGPVKNKWLELGHHQVYINGARHSAGRKLAANLKVCDSWKLNMMFRFWQMCLWLIIYHDTYSWVDILYTLGAATNTPG